MLVSPYKSTPGAGGGKRRRDGEVQEGKGENCWGLIWCPPSPPASAKPTEESPSPAERPHHDQRRHDNFAPITFPPHQTPRTIGVSTRLSPITFSVTHRADPPPPP